MVEGIAFIIDFSKVRTSSLGPYLLNNGKAKVREVHLEERVLTRGGEQRTVFAKILKNTQNRTELNLRLDGVQ